jgi:ElaB/YqjD/DUF883 family membrane-anchored ribosome-binding protein
METEPNMADPVRNDEPLSSMRLPETEARPGPVPVTRTPTDTAGLLPERATDKPLGEWPRETLDDLRDAGEPREPNTVDNLKQKGASALDTLRDKTRPVADFVQDRVADMRYRLRIIRGRVESGELQGELRDRATEIGDEASRQARIARSRAEFYARNFPLQFIAGAAAAGFAIGFLLRMWRDE